MSLEEQLCAIKGVDPQELGVLLVDHGSQRDASNVMLNDVVEHFRKVTGFRNVAPAHMELAKPTIRDAFAQVVKRGAKQVVVLPYFLAPGRHWDSDIPCLATEAAQEHPGIEHLVAAPLGLHEAMITILCDRMLECLHSG